MPGKNYRTTGRRHGGTTTTGNPSNNWTTRSYSPSSFKNVQRNIQQRIGSFRNINAQFSGNGKVTAFSPTGVNKWITYINNGNCVYKFTNADFCRKFGTSFNSPTTITSATRTLRAKYGAGIKDVTRGKGGCWLIAATPNVNSGPFNSYKW